MTRAMSPAMRPQQRGNLSLSMISTYIFAILSFIFALLSESPTFVEANANNDAQQPGTTLLPRPIPSGGRPQLMVAIYCGGLSSAGVNSRSASTLYYNQYLEVDSRKWRTDRDATATCTHDKQAILNYCKKVYPDHDIRNIVESSRPYKIDNWCRLGGSKRKCRARLTTRPYRCLEGTFQSDALLVPERCVFDHVHNKSVCESSDSWNRSATEACHSKSMKLQSFGMLQPCGLDVFSGVEFVCCPKGDGEIRSKSENGQTEGSNSFAQAANSISPSWSKEAKDEQSNSIKTSDDIPKKHHERSDNQGTEQSESESDDENEDDDDEYDEEEDGYDDDSSSWNGDKPSSTSTTTSTTTTTTTTTTELPIQRYLSHFDLTHEHDEYRKAELSIQNSYDDKVAHVMRDWNQLNRHFEEMKKRDPIAAEEFRKKMTHQFKKTLDAVQQETSAEKHQLASMHAERAMAIINRRKKAAMDCLTQALDRIPIRTRQIERCIVRLLKALEKDRAHTLRQYKNLLNLNTGEALREKKTILDHLVTLNRAANQSIAMLDRSPILVNKLKASIVALWHRLRNVPLDEPIVKESEEKIMNQYEEEAAQRKIELERERLAQLQINQERPENQVKVSNNIIDSSPKADDQATHRGIGTNPTPAAQDVSLNTQPTKSASASGPSISLDPQTANENQSTIPTAAKLVRQTELGDKDRTHYQANSVGFAHLRLESPYHELSYSVKHEPLEGNMKFGSSTILVSSFAAVILLAFFGVKYYGKNSTRAYRRQGFAEVGRSCAEEKTMAQMQFNGYENPAYKFFEAEA